MPEALPVILLVEDDDDVRLSLRDYLERKGYEVLVASEGVGAIKILIDREVDLIVTDYRMELFGGEYWIKFLARFFPAVPAIVASGFLFRDLPPPFRVVKKPFDYDELATAVHELLGGVEGR